MIQVQNLSSFVVQTFPLTQYKCASKPKAYIHKLPSYSRNNGGSLNSPQRHAGQAT